MEFDSSSFNNSAIFPEKTSGFSFLMEQPSSSRGLLQSLQAHQFDQQPHHHQFPLHGSDLNALPFDDPDDHNQFGMPLSGMPLPAAAAAAPFLDPDFEPRYAAESFENNGGKFMHGFMEPGGGWSNFPGNHHHFLTHQTKNSLMPDSVNGRFLEEASCITADTGYGSKKKKRVQMRKENKISKKLPSNIIKGQWTPQEDRLLVQLVGEYGIKKWSHIAKMLEGRVGKQCRERWHNHLRPDIRKDAWSEEEDRVLIEAHMAIGNRWAEIARRLPGRTENTIKNHWNATKRRQNSKRIKGKDLDSKCTSLQNYIKSVTFPPSSSSYAAVEGGDEEPQMVVPSLELMSPRGKEKGMLYEKYMGFGLEMACGSMVDDFEMPPEMNTLMHSDQMKSEMDLLELICQGNL